jgi:hypothetical protein
MKAITIWQPWATLIAIGAKRFEFRGWAPPRDLVGQRIAIHAGARRVQRIEIHELLLKLRSPSAAETGLVIEPAIALLDRVSTAPGSLPLSSILCTAILGTPIRDADLAAQLGTRFVNDSDRAEHSNWGWPLTEIEVLEPFVPARGAQGWWDWSGAHA